jgi:hypothetical protein
MGNSKLSRVNYNRKRKAKREAARLQNQGFTVSLPPSQDISAEELIERRIEDFNRVKEYEEGRKLIQVKVTQQGPIGILHFGDPHVDDDGCDWPTLKAHVELVQRTPGLFAANVGDTRNNWVGRLAKLYGAQGTSAKHALILARWLVDELKGSWLYMVGGNHDAWSGEDDPMAWIAEQANALYEPSEARLGLNFMNGRQLVVNCRHDFAGSSQWNPTHGPMKAAQLGLRDDIMICGHKHTSGYSPLKDPETGKILHCIQVASYKRYDRYAREKGFRDQSLSPCAMTVIDPDATNPANLIQVFWDAERGAEYLTWLRSRVAA